MKRILSLFLSLLLLLLMVAGCTPAETKNGNDDPTAGTTAPAETTTEKPEETQAGEKVMLTAALSMDIVEVYEAFIDSYQDKYPNVTIDLVSIGYNVNEYLTLAMSSETMPELFSINSDAQGRQMADEGWIMDLKGTAVEDLVSPTVVPFFTSDTGILYGIPYGIATVIMYYNVDLFKDAGVELPTNWEEFLAACQALKAEGIAPMALAMEESSANTVWSAIFGNLESEVNPDFEKQMLDGSYVFADGKALETFERFMVLADNDYLQEGAVGADFQAALDTFNQGEAAMHIAGSWFATSIEGFGDFELTATNVPFNDKGKVPYTLISPETGWGGSGKSTHNEEILNFLTHFVGEGRTIMQNGRGSIPVTKDTSGSVLPDVLNAVVPDLLASTQTASLYFVYLPAAFQSDLQKIYQELVLGAATPEEAVATMQSVFDAAFD